MVMPKGGNMKESHKKAIAHFIVVVGGGSFLGLGLILEGANWQTVVGVILLCLSLLYLIRED